MKIEEAIKQTKFANNIHKAIVNVIYTHNTLLGEQLGVFKQFGLLPQHYNILRILRGKYPKAMCPGEIKEVMLDKNPDLTRLLDKLEKAGRISRKLNEINRRMIDVSITETGLQLLEEMQPHMEAHYTSIKNLITENEAETLSNLLDKLRG